MSKTLIPISSHLLIKLTIVVIPPYFILYILQASLLSISFFYSTIISKSLMNQKIGLAVILMITLGTTVGIGATGILQQEALAVQTLQPPREAPPAITGDNIYVAWWTNKTGNDEVMFRASTDAGKTFGDKINLSNTTDSDSTRVQIDSDTDSVVVTWWETNQTSDVPVMKVSNDNGKTFGETIMLSTNGTIG
jgi:hypothetical protein